MWFVELVRAVAWPTAVVVIALGYKPELLRALPVFLRRAIKFEGFGVKAEVGATEPQQQIAADNPAAEKLPEATLVPDPRPAVNLMEAQLRGQASGIEAPRREPILLRALAMSRLEAGHLFVYNRIYGSQIVGLRRLNEAGQATVDQAREFFRPVEEQFPQVYASYGFDGWLKFLKDNSLVVQNGDVLEITEFGRDFLTYLTNQRLAEGKPF
jgi:hypothetical protein